MIQRFCGILFFLLDGGCGCGEGAGRRQVLVLGSDEFLFLQIRMEIKIFSSIKPQRTLLLKVPLMLIWQLCSDK